MIDLLRCLLIIIGISTLTRALRRMLMNRVPSRPEPFVYEQTRPPVVVTKKISPYDVLGVGAEASQEDIRHAYQQLVRQYHPDQVAHLGQELRDVAQRRTQEINAAYNMLKKG